MGSELSPMLARPFLKWAGGKNQLVPELLERLSRVRTSNRYHEPFIGGGALFFRLRAHNQFKNSFLSDNNAELIATYQGVQLHVDEVIAILKQHANSHSKQYYYEVRSQVLTSIPERAARVIYLNKTCFNGLYRENAEGKFNVPMGSYKKPTICNAEVLKAASAALQRAEIEVRSFEAVLQKAKRADFVYFDPPYDPVSKTASFNGYDKGGFNREQQLALRDVFLELGKRGIFALLSNSYTPFVLEAYQHEGVAIEEVFATRAVNSRADRRGKVSEALINNFAIAAQNQRK